MTYRAEIINIDPLVEDLVKLKIGTHILSCFAQICPFPIQIGGVYEINLYLFFLDDPQIVEVSNDSLEEMIHTNEAFGYSLTGILHDGVFSVGELSFSDKETFSDFQYLEGKTVKLQANRIDAEFLH